MKTRVHIGLDFKKPDVMVKMTLMTKYYVQWRSGREQLTQ